MPNLQKLETSRSVLCFKPSTCCPECLLWKNVALPLIYAGYNKSDRLEKARQVMSDVGLESRMYHKPNELSGGQRQRVAIARALINDPALILADEPTGNLDTRTSEEIINIFKDLHRKGNTILLVTHEPDIAAHARRIVRLRDGLVESDSSESAFPNQNLATY
jgi:putative ABC transport system ATP-binding protein